MKKALIISISLLSAIGLIGYGSCQGYEHHLSADLKRTLIASMDPSVTIDDLHVYLRDARLQVRTDKDKEVPEKFQTSVRLLEDSKEICNRQDKEIHALVSGNGPYTRVVLLIMRYYKAHLNPPKELLAQYENDQKREQHREMIWDLEQKRSAEEERAGKKLNAEVRESLGLPDLPVMK
jgi:hypothetical protein